MTAVRWALAAVVLLAIAFFALRPREGARAYRDVRRDLARLDTAETAFHQAHGRFAASTGELTGWQATGRVQVRIVHADSTSYLARGTHPDWPVGMCQVGRGSDVGPATQGVVRCPRE